MDDQANKPHRASKKSKDKKKQHTGGKITQRGYSWVLSQFC